MAKDLWLGILTMVLVFGMMATGCDNGSTDNAKVDSALNGTWIGVVVKGGEDFEGEMKFNNGNFEIFAEDVIGFRGTYTTNGSKISIKVTHVHGRSIMFSDLQNKWYSKTELKSASKMTDEVFNERFGGMFESQTKSYSVNGNKLTLTWFSGDEPTIYIRK
jgi:hypothetical protein